jgi:hypothetical protein
MGAVAGHDVAAFNRIMETARLTPEFKDSQQISEILTPIWDQIWVTGETPLKDGVDLACQRINEHFGSA